MGDHQNMITENGQHKFGCLMGLPSKEICSYMVDFAKKIIPTSILYTEPDDDSYGHTDQDFHVTLKYGYTSDLSTKQLGDILRGTKPFNITLTGLDQFNNDAYDVVKFSADSDELRRIRALADQYPNDDKYPTFKPHLTLGYVKKSTFPYITKKLNIKLPITRFKYSRADGTALYISL